MELRRAALDDAAAACDVIRRSITELCAADHHDERAAIDRWLSNKTPEDIENWIGSARNIVLVAIDKKKLIGVGAMTQTGHVTLNYVHPDSRFRGVSKALLSSLEHEAKMIGLRALSLQSTKTAEKFYRAAGFVDEPNAACHGNATLTKMLSVST